jgi:hypothetical protein
VVSETGGKWRHLVMISGAALGGTKAYLLVTSVSCASPGNCAAGGYYCNSSGQAAFVVTEADGHWGQAQNVPGLAALNTGLAAQVNSISCPSANHCTAVGQYAQNAKHYRAFVVSES